MNPQQRTQRQLLDDLVASHRMTPEEADGIAHAPEWSLTVTELVSYLASLVVLAGLVRVAGVAFAETSRTVVACVLGTIGTLLGVVAVRVPKHNETRRRFAEVIEGASAVALLASAAIVLEISLQPETTGLVVSIPLVAWGYVRSRDTLFVGSLMLTVGMPLFVYPLADVLNGAHDEFDRLTGAYALAGGAVLWALGQRRTGSAFVQRAGGCLVVLQASFMMSGTMGDAAHFVPFLAGAALFVLGSWRLQYESLGAGAIGIIAGVSLIVSDWFPSEMTRGLATVGAGASVLLAAGARIRRRPPAGGLHPADS